MQFRPPDDEHMCSKHVEAWNKTYCKTKILCIKLVITEINGTVVLTYFFKKWLYIVNFVVSTLFRRFDEQ